MLNGIHNKDLTMFLITKVLSFGEINSFGNLAPVVLRVDSTFQLIIRYQADTC